MFLQVLTLFQNSATVVMFCRERAMKIFIKIIFFLSQFLIVLLLFVYVF